MSDKVSLLLLIVLLFALIVFGPLVTIWSLNTLFPLLAIPYNFYTWLAMIIVQAATFGKFKR